MLTDRDWKLEHTPEDGALLRLCYVPALQNAERCDQLTVPGVEGLVRDAGCTRLIIGSTLDGK